MCLASKFCSRPELTWSIWPQVAAITHFHFEKHQRQAHTAQRNVRCVLCVIWWSFSYLQISLDSLCTRISVGLAGERCKYIHSNIENQAQMICGRDRQSWQRSLDQQTIRLESSAGQNQYMQTLVLSSCYGKHLRSQLWIALLDLVFKMVAAGSGVSAFQKSEWLSEECQKITGTYNIQQSLSGVTLQDWISHSTKHPVHYSCLSTLLPRQFCSWHPATKHTFESKKHFRLRVILWGGLNLTLSLRLYLSHRHRSANWRFRLEPIALWVRLPPAAKTNIFAWNRQWVSTDLHVLGHHGWCTLLIFGGRACQKVVSSQNRHNISCSGLV